MFKKRIGPNPHADGQTTGGVSGCPDIWELEDGNFVIIGVRKTNELKGMLPETASCSHDEEIVWIPRKLLVQAKNDIPNDQ